MQFSGGGTFYGGQIGTESAIPVPTPEGPMVNQGAQGLGSLRSTSDCSGKRYGDSGAREVSVVCRNRSALAAGIEWPLVVADSRYGTNLGGLAISGGISEGHFQRTTHGD